MRLFPFLTSGTVLLGMVCPIDAPAQMSTSFAALPDGPSAQSAGGAAPTPLTLGPDYGPLPSSPLSTGEKSKYFLKRAFGPGAIAGPILVGAYNMANPRDQYPREWKQGAAAFGRNVGAAANQNTTANTTRFVTGLALREDPRYYPSENRDFLPRVTHAVLFTLVKRSDSGSKRIAFSNFAGAVVGGFVGNAYLPDNYANSVHAGQRSALQLAGFATDNLTREFKPELTIVARKLHLPVPDL